MDTNYAAGTASKREAALHSRDFAKLLFETFNKTNDYLRGAEDLVKIGRLKRQPTGSERELRPVLFHWSAPDQL